MDDWTPIPGYEGWYEAHPDGRIRRAARDGAQARELKPGFGPASGLVVVFSLDGRTKTFTVAGLITRTFLGERPAGAQIAFADGDRRNVALANLSYRTERRPRRPKIAEETAVRIYGDYHRRGERDLEAIAARHNTSVTIVDRIVRGKSWTFWTRHKPTKP